MAVELAVVPGLFFLAVELLVLAGLGFVVARVALRQSNDGMALAQGLVIGPAMWGLTVNFSLQIFHGGAGALVGWIVLVMVVAGLTWFAPSSVRPRLRSVLVIAGAGVGCFSAMLAVRQLFPLCDAATHLGMSAAIRAGGWPPSMSWIPGQPIVYHYGIDLLVGLLSPSFGPDLSFTTEILGAYAWTSFALVVATTLYHRSGRVALVTLTPMLLSPGAWTLGGVGVPPKDILQTVVPVGLPDAGLRASLAGLYWPNANLETLPQNVDHPSFMLSYALAFTVLASAASSRERSWLAALVLAALIGFLGLLDEVTALIVLALWSSLEAIRVFLGCRPFQFRRSIDKLSEIASIGSRSSCFGLLRVDKSQRPEAIPAVCLLQAVSGPVLAGLLLALGGGALSSLLIGRSIGASSLALLDDPGGRHPLGTLVDLRAGGVGVLGLGVIPVAIVAVALAVRSRLVLALVGASCVFMIGAIILQYEPKQDDVTRLDGHARNFALLGFLIGLTDRLATLRWPWKHIVTVGVVILIVWPTVISAARGIHLALGRGVQLSNAQPEQYVSEAVDMGGPTGRYAIRPFTSDRISTYIREHTEVDARILSPSPHEMSVATGRPNASGFAGLTHLYARPGPAFLDAQRYLEPRAVRRGGFTYIHATDGWIAELPDRAQRWLTDPRLFQLLVRDGTDTLYRIQPDFLRLHPRPMPQSFEALREAVPTSSAVYLTEALDLVARTRLASVLGHTRLFGDVDPSGIYLLTNIPHAPLGTQHVDVVILPQGSTSFFKANVGELSSAWQTPVVIWRSQGLVAYATGSDIAPAIEVLSQASNESKVEILASEVDLAGDAITFAVRFTYRASERWTGSDWLVIPLEDTPWALPETIDYNRNSIIGAVQWYSGHYDPGQETTTRVFRFSPLSANLAVQGPDGIFAASRSSGSGMNQGVWALVLRLRQNYRQAAVLPVLKIIVSETESVSFTLYDYALDSLT